MKTYNNINFHKYTFCLWKEISVSDFELQKSNFKSKSGSEYYFTDEGVYRQSNHWGRAANCRWKLIPLLEFKNQQTKIGFAKWTDFYPNDELANLFFIQVNFEDKTVDFFHKDMPFYDGRAILRNASETSKTIKIIKEIMNEDEWAKYLKFENLEVLRNNLINDLIFSKSTFNEIKKKYF